MATMTRARNFLCSIVAFVFAVLAAGMALATAAYTFHATYQLLITDDNPIWSIARAAGCLVLTLALWVLAQLNEFEYAPARRPVRQPAHRRT